MTLVCDLAVCFAFVGVSEWSSLSLVLVAVLRGEKEGVVETYPSAMVSPFS